MLHADLARKRPQDLALDDGSRRLSWAELADRTTRLSHWLQALGARPGERIATLMHNRAECIETLVAAIQAGLWITPINWHLTRDEIAYVVADSGARVLLCDPAHEALAREVFDGPVVVAGPAYEAGLAGAPDAPLSPDAPAGGPMIYTSGTTGRPKGVRRRVPATLAAARDAQLAYARATGLSGPGPHLITGPCYHAAPLMFAVYAQTSGAPLVILPRFREREALACLQEREIGQTHLVPTMFVRLLRLPDEERAAFHAPALQLVLHGAAPVSRAVKQRMLDWWGPVLVEYWGATESGVITLADSADWLAHPETVGRALPAWEVFAADASGRRLPDGETGLLYARQHSGEPVFEYHGAPDKTRACHLDPHTFTIGDIGRVDPDGHVYLADRQSHTIITGGVNVYPAEIEAVLQEHPAVADVAVFGVPDDEWGESVKAAVELAPGHAAGEPLAAAILAFARARLAGYKAPRSVDFHDALPRHASGKLYLRQLRDPYWAGRSRRI